MLDKSVTILFGGKCQANKIIKLIEENKSLSINGQQVKIKQEENIWEIICIHLVSLNLLS